MARAGSGRHPLSTASDKAIRQRALPPEIDSREDPTEATVENASTRTPKHSLRCRSADFGLINNFILVPPSKPAASHQWFCGVLPPLLPHSFGKLKLEPP